MAAEASSGTNQQLTLDYSSFEKLLAAAWVLQCLQDQLHGPRVDRSETIAQPVKIQKELEIPSSALQAAMEPVLQFSLGVTGSGSDHQRFTGRPAPNDTVTESAETLHSPQTETLNFDAAVKIEPEPVELKESLRSENRATVDPVNLPLAGLTNLATNHGDAWARRRAAFNLRAASLRTALNRAVDAIPNLLPTFRVNLSLRALRAVAIATPVWMLSLVAALLFLEVWRHGSFQSAQAISRPSPATVAAATSSTSTTLTTTALTTTTQPLPADVNRADNQPRWTNATPPLETSHKRITDGPTRSAVEQLSRYELKGLRRQAKYGDETAAFTLGMAYEVGHFVPQNCQEAARWVISAAEADDAAAQFNLGLRYRDGDGVPADRDLSKKWLRKAAALRNRQAKRALKMLASR